MEGLFPAMALHEPKMPLDREGRKAEDHMSYSMAIGRVWADNCYGNSAVDSPDGGKR